MSVRTVSIAGGNWNALTCWDEGAIPTASDDVVFRSAGNSGAVTITAAAACRSIDTTYYSNTITNNGFNLSIGASTAPPSNIALKFISTMTYNPAVAHNIFFVSTYTGAVLDIDFGAKTIHSISNNNTASYRLVSTFTANGSFGLTNGTINTNNINFTCNNYSSTGNKC